MLTQPWTSGKGEVEMHTQVSLWSQHPPNHVPGGASQAESSSQKGSFYMSGRKLSL